MVVRGKNKGAFSGGIRLVAPIQTVTFPNFKQKIPRQ